MAKYILDRRGFLRRTGDVVLVVAATGTAAFWDPGKAWAITLEAMDDHAASTLLRMCRVLYPHEGLGDMYYATVVEALDSAAAEDGELAVMIKEGIGKLDGTLGVPFVQLSEGTQVEVLESMQTDPFFQKVRGDVVYQLYNNPLVWRHFGYEGASYDQGGYLFRGFQDAGWLETPPADVSPPPYLG